MMQHLFGAALVASLSFKQLSGKKDGCIHARMEARQVHLLQGKGHAA